MTDADDTPTALYGTFSERGWRFVSYGPANDKQARVWLVKISFGDQPQIAFRIPMLYAPRFGYDVGDVAALNAVTDQVLALLPSNPPLDAETILAILRAAEGPNAEEA